MIKELKNSSHFSVIADEVTSHGKEILSVCLRFLEIDHKNLSVLPKKHEALLDFHFLERITGKSIAEGILKVIKLISIIVEDKHMTPLHP